MTTQVQTLVMVLIKNALRWQCQATAIIMRDEREQVCTEVVIMYGAPATCLITSDWLG